MLHNIVHAKAPVYLVDMFTELQRIPVHNYALRTSEKLRIPFSRLNTYKNSFFPRSIESWNKLPTKSKRINSYTGFKEALKQRERDKNILYYYGERWSSVHHARMRMGCSKLNKDLSYNLHVSDDPSCTCGAPLEDAKHYFLQCPLFADIRQQLMIDLQGTMPITIKNLLFGNSNYEYDVNKSVFAAVHTFIVKSKRFI
mgnify:FL=1